MNESIIDELSARIKELSAQTEQEIDDIRVKLLGKKGDITRLFEEFRTVPAEQKRLFRKIIHFPAKNRLKTFDGLIHRHILAGRAGEVLRHMEWL